MNFINFVRPNHFYRDKLPGSPGEGLVYGCKGSGTKLVAKVVKGKESITRGARGRKPEHEAWLESVVQSVCQI